MDTKKNTPSVIEKLMGFDELPHQQPSYKQFRVLSEDYLRKSAAIDFLLKRSLYEDPSFKKMVQKQQELNYDYLSNGKLNRLGKENERRNVLRSLQKLDGGSVVTEKDCLNKLSKSPLELKDEPGHSSIRIFVSRQSLGNCEIGARSLSSPKSCLCFPLSCRDQGICKTNKKIVQQTKKILNGKHMEVLAAEARVKDKYCEKLCEGKNKDKRESEPRKIIENSQEVGSSSKEFTLYQKSTARNMNCLVDKHCQNDGGSRFRRKQENTKRERLILRDSRFRIRKPMSSSYVHPVNNIKSDSQSLEKVPINHEGKSPFNSNREKLEENLLDLSEEISMVSKWEDLDNNQSILGVKDEPETEDVRSRNAVYSYSEICDSPTVQNSPLSSVEDGLKFSSCTKDDLEFSLSSGDTYQPSPNSVLETPFTENILSSYKGIDNVNADLYGVWMQLHFLEPKKDDTITVEEFMMVSSDEDSMNELVDYSQESYRFTEHFSPEESRNYSYLSDVLDEADFFGQNFESVADRFYSPEIPLEPSLFNALEKKYGNHIYWKKSERKLLFDRINSGLMEILWPYCRGSSTYSKPLKTRVSDTLARNVIEEDLWVLLISQENEVSKVLSEKALGKENMWLDLGDDVDSIGRDIEVLLFDELVAELF